jgi:hypothetical protein
MNWVSPLDIYKPSSRKKQNVPKPSELYGNASDRLGFGQSLVGLDPSWVRSLSNFAAT